MLEWLAALCSAAWLAGPQKPLFTEAPPHPSPPASVQGLPDLTHAAAVALPAVVSITTTQFPDPATTDNELRELLERMHEGVRRGIGSGFIIHPEGFIVTNAHVVEGAELLTVDLGEAGTRPARLVGLDSESDLALLKVDVDRPLPFVTLGDSDRLAVAEWVMVIGSPFGLTRSVTVGIVSQLGRSEITPLGHPGTYEFIQTDAPINPGNSGGPVLNQRGEVVAVATAVNASGQGIGFAVPINMAKFIVTQLYERGRVTRSWIGIAVRQPEADEGRGVVVTEVEAGSPAALAGIRAGDLVTSFEGRTIRSPGRLRWYVSTAGVGRSIELRLRHGGGAERSVRVALSATPPSEEARDQARAAVGP